MNVTVHTVKYKAVARTRSLSHRDHHTVTHRVTVALSLCHQCRHAVTHRWRNTHSHKDTATLPHRDIVTGQTDGVTRHKHPYGTHLHCGKTPAALTPAPGESQSHWHMDKAQGQAKKCHHTVTQSGQHHQYPQAQRPNVARKQTAYVPV